MKVWYKVNRIALITGLLLLGIGLLCVTRIKLWDIDSILRFGAYARVCMLLAAVAGVIPVLSWSWYSTVLVFRRYGPTLSILLAVGLLIVFTNLTFWALVTSGFAPARQQYRDGQIIWVGHNALLFGHGFWQLSDGYWQHYTTIRLDNGSVYRGPTLDLLTRLRSGGARNIWGTWCYSGNYPYIRKDLVTGKVTPWPSYTSYNKSSGQTIPIWLGATFVRLGVPKNRYTVEPTLVERFEADTLRLVRPSLSKLERAFQLVQRKIRGLPQPDSISWQPVQPDTVYSVSWSEYRNLTPEEKQFLRSLEYEQATLKARVGVAHYWIRGRAFPVYVRVPARVVRRPKQSLATEESTPANPNDVPLSILLHQRSSPLMADLSMRQRNR